MEQMVQIQKDAVKAVRDFISYQNYKDGEMYKYFSPITEEIIKVSETEECINAIMKLTLDYKGSNILKDLRSVCNRFGIDGGEAIMNGLRRVLKEKEITFCEETESNVLVAIDYDNGIIITQYSSDVLPSSFELYDTSYKLIATQDCAKDSNPWPFGGWNSWGAIA